MKRMKNQSLLAAVTIVALTAIAWTGCGDNPAMTSDLGGHYTEGNPPPFLTTNAPGTMGSASADEWYTVASQTVSPGSKTTVEGSRYYLVFEANSLTAPAEITISEHDSGILDVQFGEHGLQFTSPVMLTVNYAGTNADPDSPNYDGSIPAFYYFNDTTGIWEEIPGHDHASRAKYKVQLNHFSRYALGGRPGDGTADW